MATNIEIKARVEPQHWPALEKRCQQLADRGPVELFQRDTFFATQTGRLKLREFSNGEAELIFYHRDNQTGPKTSAYELLPCPAPEALRRTLEQTNGIRGVVAKHRRVYFVGPTRIHLDDVEGLGTFIELEVVLQRSRSAEESVVDQTNQQDVSNQEHGLDPAQRGLEIARELMQRLEIEEASLIDCAYIDLLNQ